MRPPVVLFGLGLSLLAGTAIALNQPPAEADANRPAVTAGASSSVLARGRYLVRIADCQTCHTQPGRAAFSGGRALSTPFGVFYTPNITPDPATGIGSWNEAEFFRAVHDGIRRDGAYLYPSFPFPSYTKLRRADVDAIWAYLRTVTPVRQTVPRDQLRWPYSMRSLMKVWRAFFFTPGTYVAVPQRQADWNQGAYLVEAVAHCGDCHTPRGRFGGSVTADALAGGTIPIDHWHAPNITQDRMDGIGAWSAQSLRDFLKSGRGPHGDAIGPMRDLVQSSLQYLADDDLNAMVAYLKTVPARPSPRRVMTLSDMAILATPVDPAGKRLYHDQCAACHGDEGRSKHAAYPDLLGNSVATNPDPQNLFLQIVRGGFQANTAANPYPYSMPPFGARLNDDQIESIANYVHGSWGNATKNGKNGKNGDGGN